MRHVVPGGLDAEALQKLLLRWPLELLLDEFERVGCDLSEPLLQLFAERNRLASPSPLHTAAVEFYKAGLARLPVCVTTNWDTLLEREFTANGYAVASAGPTSGADSRLSDQRALHMLIFHPHGSLGNADVVCSFQHEQRQFNLNVEWWSSPVMLLGYSGYEPSLYMYLETDQPQLWCVRSLDELQIPAKRRLLSRPNIYVYVGDLRVLLNALGVLPEPSIALESPHFEIHGVSPETEGSVSLLLAATEDPAFCLGALARVEVAMLADKSPQAGLYRLHKLQLLRALAHHVRDRLPYDDVLLALMSALRSNETEQQWITLLAHVLRHDTNVTAEMAAGIVERADKAAGARWKARRNSRTARKLAYDDLVFGLGSRVRSGFYKRHLSADREKRPEVFEYLIPKSIDGNMGAAGELIELLAFELVRGGDHGAASACFDYAATCFYLTGHWNAGRMNEWASKNTALQASLLQDHPLSLMIRVSAPQAEAPSGTAESQ
jgi:hypothetical protein